MRRLLVVVAVLSALLFHPVPAHAVGANLCTWDGYEAYPVTRLTLVPVPNIAVHMQIRMNCVVSGLSPMQWEFQGPGVTNGSCAAEAGQAHLVGGNSSGDKAQVDATWVRVGVYGVMTFRISTLGGPTAQWVLAGPMGWVPDNVANCVAPGVYVAQILGYGPLVGV